MSAPVLSGSQTAQVLIKIFNNKLSARPNGLKFHQLISQYTGIDPHNTDYDRKLGVMAPLKHFCRWKAYTSENIVSSLLVQNLYFSIFLCSLGAKRHQCFYAVLLHFIRYLFS